MVIAEAAVAPNEAARARVGGSPTPLKRLGNAFAWLMNRLRPLKAQQPPAHHEDVRQRTGDHEPMPVLGQAPVTDLGELEDALDHPDGMLDARPDAGLPPIRRALLRRSSTPLSEVARVRRTH